MNTRVANPDELLGFIKQKILEEANEVVQAKDSLELAEELADLMEVIRALAINQRVTEMMFLKRDSKYAEKGGFEKGIILIGDCKK